MSPGRRLGVLLVTCHSWPSGYAPELTSSFASKTPSLAEFGLLAPADFWAFDSMRRRPTAQTLSQKIPPRTVAGRRRKPAPTATPRESKILLFW